MDTDEDNECIFKFICDCKSKVILTNTELHDHFFDCPKMWKDYYKLFNYVATITNKKNPIQWQNLASVLNILSIEVKRKISSNSQIIKQQHDIDIEKNCEGNGSITIKQEFEQ